MNSSNSNSHGVLKKKRVTLSDTDSSNASVLPSTAVVEADADPLLQFYIFDVSRERNLHLNANPKDKRLLLFGNVSTGLYKIGLRNGK